MTCLTRFIDALAPIHPKPCPYPCHPPTDERFIKGIDGCQCPLWSSSDGIVDKLDAIGMVATSSRRCSTPRKLADRIDHRRDRDAGGIGKCYSCTYIEDIMLAAQLNFASREQTAIFLFLNQTAAKSFHCEQTRHPVPPEAC